MNTIHKKRFSKNSRDACIRLFNQRWGDQVGISADRTNPNGFLSFFSFTIVVHLIQWTSPLLLAQMYNYIFLSKDYVLNKFHRTVSESHLCKLPCRSLSESAEGARRNQIDRQLYVAQHVHRRCRRASEVVRKESRQHARQEEVEDANVFPCVLFSSSKRSHSCWVYSSLIKRSDDVWPYYGLVCSLLKFFS